jgi:hypothetical protein
MKDILATSDVKFMLGILFCFDLPRDQEETSRVQTLTEIEKTD